MSLSLNVCLFSYLLNPYVNEEIETLYKAIRLRVSQLDIDCWQSSFMLCQFV